MPAARQSGVAGKIGDAGGLEAVAPDPAGITTTAGATFGIGVTVRDGTRKGVFCDPPGSPQGGSGLQADQKTAPPNLWVESEQNFDVDRAFKVRAFVANAYVV